MSIARALLVDLDGTLADTRDANWRAYAAALREAGVEIAFLDFATRSEGRGWREFLPPILAAAGCKVPAADIARRKRELYPAELDRVAINYALVALIETCRASSATALVTTASAASAGSILARFDLARLFDTVVVGDDVARQKPAPDAYALAARRLGYAPEECLVIEDSDIGIAAGLAFGAAVLRVRL